MAEPMSARAAWEIAKGGPPAHGWEPYERYLNRQARYARACAIVEACVAEHEARVAYERGEIADPRDAFALQHHRGETFKRTCALERGEDGGA